MHERFSRRARAYGCGARDEAHRPACGDGVCGHRRGGSLYFVGGIRCGRRGVERGNAVFVRHAGKQALFRCRRARHSYLARLGDLSHALSLRSAERQKKERRKDWRSLCGIVAVKSGNRRDRPRALSCVGIWRNDFVSFLHFL